MKLGGGKGYYLQFIIHSWGYCIVMWVYGGIVFFSQQGETFYQGRRETLNIHDF